MGFYEKFAQYFDQIFPIYDAKVEFLKHHLKDANEVLEVGCATGETAITLSENGFNIDAIDLSKAMIELAKLKAIDRNSHVSFWECDMRNLDAVQRYDAIYMIGNTVVHLRSIEEIYDVLKRTYQALTRKGTLIIQILNYDRILSNEAFCLPKISGNGFDFYRLYSHKPPFMEFEATLTLENEVLMDTTKLFPLAYQALYIMLESLGYQDIKAYNGYSNEPYSMDLSYQLCVVAKKHEE